MSEGLKRHHHQYYEYHIKNYYDKYRHVMVKHITYRCMICGKTSHERYEEYQPPPKIRKNKALIRYRKKHGA